MRTRDPGIGQRRAPAGPWGVAASHGLVLGFRSAQGRAVLPASARCLGVPGLEDRAARKEGLSTREMMGVGPTGRARGPQDRPFARMASPQAALARRAC